MLNVYYYVPIKSTWEFIMTVSLKTTNETPIQYTSLNGTVFKSERADLTKGVTYEIPYNNACEENIRADFAEFGAWLAVIIHPELNSFKGFDSIRYVQSITNLVVNNHYALYQSLKGTSELSEMLTYYPEDDSMLSQHYLKLDHEDYVANVRFHYDEQTHTMEISFTTDDEDNGEQCPARMTENEIKYVTSKIEFLKILYKNQFSQSAFSYMKWKLIELPLDH
jgi:hypothetical protein